MVALDIVSEVQTVLGSSGQDLPGGDLLGVSVVGRESVLSIGVFTDDVERV